jgi:peroxiredoxin
MNAKPVIYVLLLTGLLAAQSELLAQGESRYTLSEDPSKAWAEIQNAYQALSRPHDWQTREPDPEQVAKFQKQECATAVSCADQARKFIVRFPTNENVDAARTIVVRSLQSAVSAGDADAEKQIAAFVSSVLADKSIPENVRATVLRVGDMTAFYQNAGMRAFTENRNKFIKELEEAGLESTKAALKQFPTNTMLWKTLLSHVSSSEGEQQKELAKEILNAPSAPSGVKTLADYILKGTKPYQVGKALDIHFTALDGREVDLANLRGSAVLVEFWATWCEPCVAELPEVKAAYEKLHGRGFEVVAISLDDGKETALRQFIKEKELPWPEYFDGKGWENRFALQYGIFEIPTMWLVDKRGNLRYTDAEADLEHRVTLLLDEQVPAIK